MRTTRRLNCVLTFCLGISAAAILLPIATASAGSFFTNFDSGVDAFGNASGILAYHGANGFEVVFDDDGSDATDGVEITSSGPGVAGDAEGDLELASNNSNHTSGIVATFSHPATSVSLFDNDNDQTAKTLFAFDEDGALIGQDGNSPYPGVPPGVFIDPADSQRTFAIDISMTGGRLIHSIEFDTLPGSAGGATDGTFFSIDDFAVEFVPEPAAALLLLVGSGLMVVPRTTIW